MQKRLMIILLIVVSLLALAIGTYSVLIKQKQSAVEFNFPKGESADKVVIESGQIHCTLKLVGGKWIANDIIAVKSGLPEFALHKLTLLKMDYPASKFLIEELQTQLNENGSTLSIYRKGEHVYTLLFTEYQGKNIVRNKKGDLYYVSIAGNQQMSLEKLFPANAQAWASQTTLKLNTSELEELNISYPRASGHSFKIIRKNNNTVLEGVDEHQMNITNMNDYLLFYTGITYNDYAKEAYEMAPEPLFVLNLKKKEKENEIYKGYQLFHASNKQIEKYKCALILDSQDTVLVSYDELDPLLAQKEYFLKK